MSTDNQYEILYLLIGYFFLPFYRVAECHTQIEVVIKNVIEKNKLQLIVIHTCHIELHVRGQFLTMKSV
jgi:hypothetical protein